jgi:hypothetical protein
MSVAPQAMLSFSTRGSTPVTTNTSQCVNGLAVNSIPNSVI